MNAIRSVGLHPSDRFPPLPLAKCPISPYCRDIRDGGYIDGPCLADRGSASSTTSRN